MVTRWSVTMPNKYIKAVKGWKYRNGDGGLAGTEVYHQVPDAQPQPGVTLPTVGSTQFTDPVTGTTFPYCVCTGVEGDFPEGDDTAVTYRYEFTTNRFQWGTDPDARRFASSIQVASRKPEPSSSGLSGFTWKYDGDNIENLEIHKRVFNCQFAVPIIVSSAKFNSWITGTVAAAAGKINGASFDGWDLGTVYFEGISGGTKYDHNGNRRWAFDLNFTLKLIPDMKNVTAANTYGTAGQYTWQHSFRGGANDGWDKPIGPSGESLYATYDLNKLNNNGSDII